MAAQMPPPRSPRSPPPPPPPPSTSLPGFAPRGPPTTSPFAGLRDLAAFSSRRPPGGSMSISSILEDPKPMRPPSPGRARSSSMRESMPRGFGDGSPSRSILGEQRPMTAAYGMERTSSEQPRRDAVPLTSLFHRDSPHSFRAFQPPPQSVDRHHAPNGHSLNGHAPPGRPSSQPLERVPSDGRLPGFRHIDAQGPHPPPPPPPALSDYGPSRELVPLSNGHPPTSQPVERGIFGGAHAAEREHPPPAAPLRIHPGAFGTPVRDDQAGLFRPAYPLPMEPDRSRESLDARSYYESREAPRSSPPVADLNSFERNRMPFADRSMTVEEHQRLEAIHRGQQLRKESDGSGPRSLFSSISPELNRRGRNSPLPQAVQGVQPRLIGPGGDNPSIKQEFGRMFVGIGSGVGSGTPTPTDANNGVTTPSRVSPTRPPEGPNSRRASAGEGEEVRAGAKTGKGGKKNGRRAREDDDHADGVDGVDGPRNKRSKTARPNHHHHPIPHAHHHPHHHHRFPEPDNGPSPFNTIRFPPTSAPTATHNSATANAAHHHHHHHHTHPTHHHHHPQRATPVTPAPPPKPTTTITSKSVLDEASAKPRKHLGSQLYSTDVVHPHTSPFTLDPKLKYTSTAKPIPLFLGKDNCTFTVRVPRWFLASSSYSDDATGLEAICRQRQIWGSDVYTDDSDVVAAAVHSGWIEGDYGEWNADLRDVFGGECPSEQQSQAQGQNGQPNGTANGTIHPPAIQSTESPPSPLTLTSKPARPVRPPCNLDAHITVLILPPLTTYVGSTQHHLKSRDWLSPPHDGMSFTILKIEFVDEGVESRLIERGPAARKKRLAEEDSRRREAARGLLLFATGAGAGAAPRSGPSRSAGAGANGNSTSNGNGTRVVNGVSVGA